MCRTFTAGQARQIIEEHGAVCYWCKAPLQTVVIDHFVPFVKGGSTTVKNGVPSCVRCNQDKLDMMPDDYLKKIAERNACGRSLADLAPTGVEPIKPVYKKVAVRALNMRDEEEAVRRERKAVIRAGLLQLDPEDDDHWTRDGYPSGQAMYHLIGFKPKCDEMYHRHDPNQRCFFCGRRGGNGCKHCPPNTDGAIPDFLRCKARKLKEKSCA